MSLLLRLAAGSMRARRSTWLVGALLFATSGFLTCGASILGGLDEGLEKVLVGMGVGHLQVYSEDAPQELSLFSDGMGADQRIVPIADYEKAARTLEELPEVSRVVPMGLGAVEVFTGNPIDRLLARVRRAVDDPSLREGDESSELSSAVAHLRQTLTLLDQRVTGTAARSGTDHEQRRGLEALARVREDSFWKDFERQPHRGLEFLENRVAFLSGEGTQLYLQYIATDLQEFAEAFPRLDVVRGSIAEGPGILLSAHFHERAFKLKSAHFLDRIAAAVESGRSLDEDPELAQLLREAQRGLDEVLFQLAPDSAATVHAALARALGEEAPLATLLGRLLELDDANVSERRAIFYRHVAAEVELYRVDVGDLLTLKAFTQGGTLRSVNVPVAGTFRFSGTGDDAVIGDLALFDLATYREVLGMPTPEDAEEIEEIVSEFGLAGMSREELESGAPIDGHGGADIEVATFDAAGPVVQSGAVLLAPDVTLEAGAAAVNEASERAGLSLKVMTWKEAAGIVGNILEVLKGIVYGVALFGLFIVGIVVSMTMVLAVLGRATEVGTLRAIGAQRSFAFQLLLLEGGLIGLVFAGLGAVAAAAFILLLGQVGIPGEGSILELFFGGPRLYPAISPLHMIAGTFGGCVASLLASTYAAHIGSSATPRLAMEAEH